MNAFSSLRFLIASTTTLSACAENAPEDESRAYYGIYEISRESISKEEGVVPSDRNSALYGFKPHREYIEYISVFEPDDTRNNR